jgi:hypothetical protein
MRLTYERKKKNKKLFIQNEKEKKINYTQKEKQAIHICIRNFIPVLLMSLSVVVMLGFFQMVY